MVEFLSFCSVLAAYRADKASLANLEVADLKETLAFTLEEQLAQAKAEATVEAATQVGADLTIADQVP